MNTKANLVHGAARRAADAHARWKEAAALLRAEMLDVKPEEAGSLGLLPIMLDSLLSHSEFDVAAVNYVLRAIQRAEASEPNHETS